MAQLFSLLIIICLFSGCSSNSQGPSTCAPNFAVDLKPSAAAATGSCSKDSDCPGYTVDPTYWAGCQPAGPDAYVTCASGQCTSWRTSYMPVKAGQSNPCVLGSLPTAAQAKSFCDFISNTWPGGQCPTGFNPEGGCFPALMSNPASLTGYQLYTSDGTFYACTGSMPTKTIGYAICIN